MNHVRRAAASLLACLVLLMGAPAPASAQQIPASTVTDQYGRALLISPFMLWNPNNGSGCFVGQAGCPGFGGSTQTNYALETGGNLAALAGAVGANGTGITPPTGGSGLLGWLSGIYYQSSQGYGSTGQTAPPSAVAMGVQNGAGASNLGNFVQAGASVPINISTATTTQLVALSGSTGIYITAFNFLANGADTVTLEYGTGSNCGTGTHALTGAYGLSSTQPGIAQGNGMGVVLFVPSGNALCVVTSAAVQLSGSLAYAQF